MNANTLTIGEVRLSYCNLFQPKPPLQQPEWRSQVFHHRSVAQDQHGGESCHRRGDQCRH